MGLDYGMAGYDFRTLIMAHELKHDRNIYNLLELYTYFKRILPKYAKLFLIDQKIDLGYGIWSNTDLDYGICPLIWQLWQLSKRTGLEVLA